MPHRDPLCELRDFAVDAAFHAGRITLRWFQSRFEVETKSDDTPVTVADRETEAFLRERISRRFPDHAILGEEQGLTGPAGASVRWILDPIDGTKSFVHGVPLYAVLIGVEVEGVSRVGVVHFPALDDMLSAAHGQGATWNGRRCRVSSTPKLSAACLTFTSERGFDRAGKSHVIRALRKSTLRDRGWSDAYAHALVATGRVDLAVEPLMMIWDSAPLLLLVAVSAA
jgi:myo-inositol-1(or 4)-monophosphatase